MASIHPAALKLRRTSPPGERGVPGRNLTPATVRHPPATTVGTTRKKQTSAGQQLNFVEEWNFVKRGNKTGVCLTAERNEIWRAAKDSPGAAGLAE
jgi:hypothetical protein